MSEDRLLDFIRGWASALATYDVPSADRLALQASLVRLGAHLQDDIEAEQRPCPAGCEAVQQHLLEAHGLYLQAVELLYLAAGGGFVDLGACVAAAEEASDLLWATEELLSWSAQERALANCA
jgi:hypothetical protein